MEFLSRSDLAFKLYASVISLAVLVLQPVKKLQQILFWNSMSSTSDTVALLNLFPFGVREWMYDNQ